MSDERIRRELKRGEIVLIGNHELQGYFGKVTRTIKRHGCWLKITNWSDQAASIWFGYGELRRSRIVDPNNW